MNENNATMETPDKRKERCSTALGYLRLAWRELEDAGVQEQFKERMVSIASDIKLALGGEERDGLDKPTSTVSG